MFNLDSVIIEKCKGCDYNVHGKCKIWLSPAARFHVSGDLTCGTATHIKNIEEESQEKIRVGQQKQKKRSK